MSDGEVRRKLAAILSADVQGYSRLMGDDEAATVRTITTYRQIFSEKVSRHHGRVVDSPGDNILAAFPSVVDAVQAAMEVQAELGRRNAQRPEQRRMDFRIGINLGDVIEEEGRLYGEGVNIAARIEGLAAPGGVCLSSGAYEQVKSKLDVEGQYLGQFDVKNIAEPVRVWALLTDVTALARTRAKRARAKKSKQIGLAIAVAMAVAVVSVSVWNAFVRPAPQRVETANPQEMAFPLPTEPSIAVLPFDNLTGNPDQEFFSDGFTEEIITTLSKIPYLFVVARNSTFTYKGKAVSVKQVAEEQGVRYVLEGSVQRSGNRVRINAQLIDAIAGHHLWAEHYDREVQDLFALQDDIAQDIMISLQVKLTGGEQLRGRHERAADPKAFEFYQRARFHFYKFTKEDNAICRELITQATQISPEFPDAWRVLAYTHLLDAQLRWAADRKASFRAAVEFGKRAYELGPTIPLTNSLLGNLELYLNHHDKAIAYGRTAVELGPNDADATAMFGMILTYSGQPKEAIPLFQRAMRLSPHYPAWYVAFLGVAYMLTGNYAAAEKALEEPIRRDSMVIPCMARLAMLKALQNDMGKARFYVAELLKLQPGFSLHDWARVPQYRHKEDLERELLLLRKAGLPEKSEGS